MSARGRIALSLLAVALGVAALPPGPRAHEGAHHDVARLTEALAARPDDVALLLERAYFHRVGGDAERSLGDLDRARSLAPGDLRIAAERGLTLARLGRAPEALQELDRVVRDGAPTAAVHNERARLLAASGRTLEAIDAYRASLALRDDVEIVLACGAMLEQLGTLDEAADLYAVAAKRLGSPVTVRAALMRVHRAAGDWAAALSLADAEIARARIKTDPLLVKAEILEAAGDPPSARAHREAALAEADAAVARKPTALHLLTRARALVALERTGEARAVLGLVLEDVPDLVPARELLARLGATEHDDERVEP